MNTKRGLSPDLGVDKLKKEQKQALKDHVDVLMTRFWEKSCCWTAYNNQDRLLRLQNRTLISGLMFQCVFLSQMNWMMSHCLISA
jgi:hypothetical protein